MKEQPSQLRFKHLGIDTYKEAVIFMRKDCHVCRSEGFEVHARINVTLDGHHILATLNTIDNGLLKPNEASLSKLAPVELTLKDMQRVVEQEQGCIVWGGSVTLSPADDILIRVERIMDLDNDGQMVASVLSKKIAASLLEFSPEIKPGGGKQIAMQLLDEGKAWKKFQAICQAQGGLREPPTAYYTHTITAAHHGLITAINNRQLARLAKLAGAPHDKAAGNAYQELLQTGIQQVATCNTITHPSNTIDLSAILAAGIRQYLT